MKKLKMLLTSCNCIYIFRIKILEQSSSEITLLTHVETEFFMGGKQDVCPVPVCAVVYLQSYICYSWKPNDMMKGKHVR